MRRTTPPLQSTRVSDRPEDWPRLFTERLNAGDLDAVVALYEADRRRHESHVVRAVPAGDVALLYTDFRGTTIAESGVGDPNARG